MKNILKVRMLGGFTLEYKGKELVLDRNNVSKTTQLFQLLLLHTQDGGISKAALIDALYGRSDVENKNGSLNNTIFRLRKQLTAAGLPESSYININGGMCTWDPDIETSVDVCDFKQTIESARHEKSQKTKMEIYTKAWKLYTGEFLPDMMGEDWAAVENIACRDMYFDCVEELCHYLKTEEKFEELHRVAHSEDDLPEQQHGRLGGDDGQQGVAHQNGEGEQPGAAPDDLAVNDPVGEEVGDALSLHGVQHDAHHDHAPHRGGAQHAHH